LVAMTEPDGDEEEPRWRFEWKNFKNNRRFPL
jgi:hypothetical protein